MLLLRESLITCNSVPVSWLYTLEGFDVSPFIHREPTRSLENIQSSLRSRGTANGTVVVTLVLNCSFDTEGQY